MKESLCTMLVFLVVSTSLNHAQEFKMNVRRSSGLVPFPRTGRHLAMASFARSEGNSGLVNFPRVGRSRSTASVSSFAPSGAREFDSKPHPDRDFDLENLDDFDYNKHYPSEWEESGKCYEELKNDLWLGNHPNSDLKKEHRHSHRCNQQTDGPWALLFATREMTNLNQQPVHNFIPRLVREVENEAATTGNIIS
ncbi:CAPA peptides-like [Venturia canescens]|uniref:CAPA peptides-like n=1 Tax=Venturia canescens TaxID=32260 RepID=UPI001C9C0658|nr:CAPA peptides-like [Venturia canescens]